MDAAGAQVKRGQALHVDSGARLHFHPRMTVAGRLLPILRGAAGVALDAVLPPRCLRCGGTVDAAGALCPGCWGAIRYLGPPQCACCGLPFEFSPGADALCGACLRARPPFERARAVFRYDAESKGLILAFKHADRTDGAAAFARWMQRAGQALLADADIIAPVPLHWQRLARRRYNQAALLGNALSRLSGVATVPDLLVRRRRTPSQGGLSAVGRRRNLQGAMAVRRRYAAAVADRRILLVDDVFTTGATAAACARALLRSGARAVDVLALAQVIRQD
jgi:ComF family protein